jgi:hypothetical protein
MMFPGKPDELTTIFITSPEGLSRHRPARTPDSLMRPAGFRRETGYCAGEENRARNTGLGCPGGTNPAEKY